MEFIRDPNELTPVENMGGLYVKREDMFRPFDSKSVNGGKLRQCFMLIDKVKDQCKGVVSCCSVYSPQAPITAASARRFGLPCVICFGGTTEDRLRKFRMPQIAERYGARNVIISRSGIHKILYGKVRPIAEDCGYFIVDYGINIMEYPDIMFNAVSRQVENIPDELDNLYITCGSGITAIGVMIGIHEYSKKVGKIVLVATAPSRKKLIDSALDSRGIQMDYEIVDLFHQERFAYEVGVKESLGSLELHPNYEAKTFRYIKENMPSDGKNLLWNVGVKPIR